MKPMLVMLAMMMAGALPVQAGTNYPALADYPAPSCIKPGPKLRPSAEHAQGGSRRRHEHQHRQPGSARL